MTTSLLCAAWHAATVPRRQVAGEGVQGAGEQDPASLDRLHDLIRPPPISGWPSTPGWTLLGLALLVALAGSTWYLVLRRRERAYRREALGELERMAAEVARAHDPATLAEALSALPALLKRTALAAWPRRRVAALTGQAWLAFLAEGSGDERFRTGAGRLLDGLSYQPGAARGLSADDAAELIALSRSWILRHRAPAAEERSRAPC